jgi:uncharacterized SAM-binding protein YcdF (DUF218 family)
MGVGRLARIWHFLTRLGAFMVVVALLGLGVGFFFFLQALDRTEAGTTTRADGIVVLTGGSQRIGDAVDLLAQGLGQRLLITGVNEKTSRGEIAGLNPASRRLFACCVDLDYRARNTIGNAVETRRWTQQHGFRSLIVVTSNYHMPRTLVEIEKVLPGVPLAPYPVVTDIINPDRWWYEPNTARVLLGEYVKYVAAIVRTRIEPDPDGAHVAVAAGDRKPGEAALPGR